jgi:hypothetical protein
MSLSRLEGDYLSFFIKVLILMFVGRIVMLGDVQEFGRRHATRPESAVFIPSPRGPIDDPKDISPVSSAMLVLHQATFARSTMRRSRSS